MANKVILTGHLGGDPKENTVGESKVVEFRFATKESWRDKASGEKKEKTTWHNVQAWGKTAETLAKYAKSGMKLLIEGKIDNSEYEKAGEKHTFSRVVVDNFEFLDSKSGESTQSEAA